MTYPSKLSEQLKAAQAYTEKIKVLEQFFNAMGLRVEENVKQMGLLTAEIDQLRAEIKAVSYSYGKEIADLQHEIDELKGSKQSRPKPKPEFISTQAMAQMAGVSSDPEKVYALRFFARQYCDQHGLEARKGEDGKGGKGQHAWFPAAAVDYAIAKLKGEANE